MTELTSTTISNDFLDSRPEIEEPAPFLYLVLQANQLLAPSIRCCLRGIDEVRIGRGRQQCAAIVSGSSTRVVELKLTDPTASSFHGRLRHADGVWSVEDMGSKNGTIVNGTRQSSAVLRDGDVLELGASFFIFRSAVRSTASDRVVLDSSELREPLGLRSMTPPFSRTLKDSLRVAASPLPVLILGETGTGKEMAARAIHAASGRTGHFQPVNCGALTPTLLHGELFGHRRGAFTGATEASAGLIRAAHGGSLFLDEVGEMSLAAQVALLRVLQEREVTPLGCSTSVPVDLRIIAATNRDPDELMRRGQLRPDLHARISGCIVRLPAVRERREDLGVVVAALLRRLAPERAANVALRLDAARLLFSHDWPLNIRQIEHSLSRALTLCEHTLTAPALVPPAAATSDDRKGSESAVEPATLRSLLERHGGNVAAVARELGKAPNQIRRWLQKFHISLEDFRSRR